MKKRRYVYMQRDRSGKPFWYFRKRGCPKVRLPGEPGSPEFERAYWTTIEESDAGKLKEVPTRDIKYKIHSKAEPKEGFVYFLRSGQTVKIGFSTTVANRVARLQTGLAEKINTFVAVAGTDFDERKMHRMLAAHRMHGEWFLNSPAVKRAMAHAAAYGELPTRTFVEQDAAKLTDVAASV